MYKIIESNGQRFELTCNSATALVYKAVFGKEIMAELREINIPKFMELMKVFKDPEIEDKTKEALENSDTILAIADIFIRLGFIMTQQGKPFEEYWNRLNYSDYVKWRAETETKTIQSPEFISPVAQLWMNDQKNSSTPKN